MLKRILFVMSLLLALPLTALAEEELALSSAPSLIAIGALLVLMLIGLFLSARRVKWDAKMIAKAAICLAMAYLLGMLRLFRMPTGGSVHLAAMLPLILFACAFGPLEGLLLGCVFGLLKLILDPYIIHPIQLLVDYPMAYAAVALACLARVIPVPKRFSLPLACVLGYLGRYVMAVLSGVIFFADYATGNVWAYSLVYNISYLGIEALICVAIAFIPGMDRLPTLLNPRFSQQKRTH